MPVHSDQADGGAAEPFDDPVLRTIAERRSIREGFADRPVDDVLLEAISRCALFAPSSKNARPWRLHIVNDRSLLREIADGVATAEGADTYVPSDPLSGRPRPEWSSTVVESADTLAAAAAAVFVENTGPFSCGRASLARSNREALADLLVGYTLEIAGIGGAVQNMWLAANALGVQASFLGDIAVDEDNIRARLQMTGDLIGVLALGYSAVAPPTRAPVVDDSDRVRWYRPGSR